MGDFLSDAYFNKCDFRNVLVNACVCLVKVHVLLRNPHKMARRQARNQHGSIAGPI